MRFHRYGWNDLFIYLFKVLSQSVAIKKFLSQAALNWVHQFTHVLVQIEFRAHFNWLHFSCFHCNFFFFSVPQVNLDRAQPTWLKCCLLYSAERESRRLWHYTVFAFTMLRWLLNCAVLVLSALGDHSGILSLLFVQGAGKTQWSRMVPLEIVCAAISKTVN